MKILSAIFALMGVVFAGSVYGSDITVFYSPSCPHCHHAREFISNTLVYEYPNISVTMVNVFGDDNRQMFIDTLKKCEYKTGGVPVLVVGEKCFQGYAESMNDDLRDAAGADLTDVERATVAENKRAMKKDADKFRREHANRANAITEYNAPSMGNTVKKNDIKSSMGLYILLGCLVAGLLVLRGSKNKKKK